MSDTVIYILAALVKSAIVIGALLTAFAYLTLIERRVVAFIQTRLGPNRAGPFGLLQPLADALKMIFKEQIIPTKARVLTFLIAPLISIVVALSAFAVVPLGGNWLGWNVPSPWDPFIADINVGLLYIFAISSLAVYGIVLGGWSSGNKYSLLGSLRSAAQMVSYEISIGLAIMGVLMWSGTLSMVGIVHAQVNLGLPFIFAQPLGFVLYCVAAVAEVNRAPFDLPEAEQELVAGYLTEYSGLRWSLYQMAEYINMITVSSIAVTLFLGGWTLWPINYGTFLSWPFIWYLIKIAIALFIFMWLRATLPRIRYDQLMKVGWRILLPLAVLNMLFTAVAVSLGWDWWTTGAFGLGVLIIIAGIWAVRRAREQGEQPRGATRFVMPPSVKLVQMKATVAAQPEESDEKEAEAKAEASQTATAKT
ncbi:MAG TPA: NADH-quinone oxidoreductase subunit NuoH [Ktedonobacterales bacterium]|nr:NADH-quinone oxidoreductase subunit NuoH [Ktedonobacterales bacterium]